MPPLLPGPLEYSHHSIQTDPLPITLCDSPSSLEKSQALKALSTLASPCHPDSLLPGPFSLCSPALTSLRPCWPPCCLLDKPGSCWPQDLCTGCFLCPGCTSPKTRYPHGSGPHLLHVSSQMSPLNQANLPTQNKTAAAHLPPHTQPCPCSPNPFGGSDGKASACSAGDPSSTPGSGRSPGEGNGNPLQYSCLKNSMDRGAWWATVHGVTGSDMTERLHFTSFSSSLFSSLMQAQVLWPSDAKSSLIGKDPDTRKD